MNEPSLVRQALDELLRLYPGFDVLTIEWQIDPPRGRWDGHPARWEGPWVLVDLGQPSDTIDVTPAWAIWKFAIWRATGAVYVVGANGAVHDDPVFVLGGMATERTRG